MLYGSGCVKLLPPEKWFGYPGCRANKILPAFGYYMRQQFNASPASDLTFIDTLVPEATSTLPQGSNLVSPGQRGAATTGRVGLRLSFAVRDVGDKTGRREIANLDEVQQLLMQTQHIPSSMENITFEHLDVGSTVRYMSGVHIFVSVHGAGMTNMFFMNPGSAVLEIIPFPLCNCRSPDYFYGVGGYYHGSSMAQGIRHYHYCVPEEAVTWHSETPNPSPGSKSLKPSDAKAGGKCSWRHLHAVEAVWLDSTRFVSLLRKIERELIAAGTIQLTKPIIVVSPHANG